MCVCGFVNQRRYWKQYVSPRDIIYSIQMVRFPYLCENLLESMHPTKNAETNGRIDDLSTLHSTSSNHSLFIQHVFLENSPRVWGTVSIEKKKPCPQGKLAIFFLDQSHSLLVKTILVEKSIFRFNATLLQTNIDVGNPSFVDHVPKKTIVFPHSNANMVLYRWFVMSYLSKIVDVP